LQQGVKGWLASNLPFSGLIYGFVVPDVGEMALDIRWWNMGFNMPGMPVRRTRGDG